ncbi:hypothetical protein KY363_02795 [Candidatus Woesearchaeota archaeon]|nr:hypothetical protein [Candidatus Woesearchaeota archaeon]
MHEVDKEMKAMFRDRKAQITVFMIVGIILLFSSALLFYIRGQIVEGIPSEFIPTLEEVPLEAQPIKVFVEDCLKQVTIDGIKKLGAHGGYIDPTDNKYGSIFSAGLSPTESEALVMPGGKSSMLPYWWYLKSPNTCLGSCEFGTNRPALYKSQGAQTSIEDQLDTYIKNNLETCLEGFSAFTEQGFDIEITGSLEPDFKVAEQDVLVILKYPMTISRAGQTTDVEQFYTKIDVNLKNVYDLATDVVNSELAFNFLEVHALNLIAMYSKPPSNSKLPPMSHFSFGYGEYYLWTTTETRDKLESYVLPPGMSMLQIIGTTNYQRHVIFDQEKGKYDRVMTGIMDKTQVTLNSSRNYTSLEARLSYLDWWPVYLNINDAEVLKPQDVGPAFAGPLFDLLGMSQYTFLYDLSFPVIVSIADPWAFNGDGFKFNFAMEANVRNNVPMNTSFARLQRAPQASYLCDVNHRNSGLITITVEDIYTGEPVSGARVDFVAGDESCFIGFANLTADNKSVISAKFPIGSGELKIVKNEKYVPLRKQFGTSLNMSGNYTMKMMPLFEINATVIAVPLSYNKGAYVVPPGIPVASLSPSETAIFTLKRQPTDDFDEYDTYLMYNATGGPQPLVIVPGEYEVRGYLMYDKELVIPQETVTYEVPFTDDETIEMNRSVFTTWNSGGVIFNNVTGYLTVEYADLRDSSLVRFKILRFPLPVTHSREIKSGPDLNQVGEHEKYSNIYKHELLPEWET